MAIDFNEPTNDTNWSDTWSQVRANVNQLAVMFEDGTGDNIPDGAVRLNKSTMKFEQWTGSPAAWAEMSIAISGSAASLKDNTTTGVMTITGLTAAQTRVKTLRDANDTILEAGGQYTISGASWTFNNTITGSINGNASTATTLQNTRTIWGQDFNGSANVSGLLSGPGSIELTGVYGGVGESDIALSGAGARMIWNPKKAAFRAGYASGTQWDVANVGNSSTAMGNSTTAFGPASTAMGSHTTASGSASTAMGYYTIASGGYSTAMGYYTTASGSASTAMGLFTKAESFASVAIGRYNIGGGTPDSWVTTDPLFEIGIGTSSEEKANAFTVYKNGNATLSGTLTAAGFSGPLTGAVTGNASTATKVNNALTAGTGLTATGTFDGSTARTFSVDFGVTGTTVCVGNDSRLADSRKCNNTFDNAATSRTNLNVPYSAPNAAMGIENTESCIAYVSNPLMGQVDGCLYSHFYSTAWKHQIQGDYRTGQIALRGKNNGVWQDWRYVLDSENFSTYASAASHAHGSITTDGKIGTTAGRVIVTGTSGVLAAKAAGSVGQFLAYDGNWATPPNTTYTGASGIVLTGTQFTHSTANGYKHIPADGATGKILGYASAGTAQWIDSPSTSPAGNSGNIQFNNSGAFGGSDSLNCSAICSLFGSVHDTTYIQNGVSVQVRDKYAYVLTYNRYFSVYDISVANPVRIASLYTSAGLTFADIRGNYAYAIAYSAGSEAGIQVFNISNPTAPVFVARAARVDNLYRCIARGDSLYVTRHGGTGAWGLYVYDVTNPSVPVLSGSVLDNTHFDSVDGLDYQNKYIFSVGRNGRITATDVSNPASPTVASSLSDATNLGGARSIKVRGNYAYVAATTANRLTVINIKNPANMTLAGTLQLSTNLAECRDIELIGDYAILPSMTNSRLTIINISNPATPSEFYSLADTTNLNGVVALAVNGSKVYAIANTGQRLSVFNIPGINIPSLNAGAILADNVSVNNSIIGRYGTFHNFSADVLSSENLTVKNLNVRQTLAASAGAATSTYLTLTINGTVYKIALLANS